MRRYKKETYRFPNAIEVYEHLDGRYGARGEPRAKRKKPTPEQIRKRNQWNKEKRARHKLRTWFRQNDYLVTLTYRKEDRPEDMDQAKKELAAFLRKVRKGYKKTGQEFRYLRNIEAGTKGAWHVHLVINRIPDADLILKASWPHGGIDFRLLYERGEFAELAAYITKTPDTDPRLREASYNSSRNLPIPDPEVKYLALWRKKPKEKSGWYIDKESYHEGTNPVTGCKYRYYTLIPIHRRI